MTTLFNIYVSRCQHPAICRRSGRHIGERARCGAGMLGRMPLVDIGSTSIWYEDHDFVDPWLPREAILMLHHFFGNSTEYAAWVPRLASGWRVKYAQSLWLDRWDPGWARDRTL